MSTETIEAKNEVAYLKTLCLKLRELYQTFPADQKKCFRTLPPELQNIFRTLPDAQIDAFKKLTPDGLDYFEKCDSEEATNFLQEKTLPPKSNLNPDAEDMSTSDFQSQKTNLAITLFKVLMNLIFPLPSQAYEWYKKRQPSPDNNETTLLRQAQAEAKKNEDIYTWHELNEKLPENTPEIKHEIARSTKLHARNTLFMTAVTLGMVVWLSSDYKNPFQFNSTFFNHLEENLNLRSLSGNSELSTALFYFGVITLACHVTHGLVTYMSAKFSGVDVYEQNAGKIALKHTFFGNAFPWRPKGLELPDSEPFVPGTESYFSDASSITGSDDENSSDLERNEGIMQQRQSHSK